MKKAALPEVEDDLSRCLDVAEGEAVVITRHGKPAGVALETLLSLLASGDARLNQKVVPLIESSVNPDNR